jgi:hypothetical protein
MLRMIYYERTNVWVIKNRILKRETR